MSIPKISLAQFNRIASGEYNAGLVDFMTDKNGKVVGEAFLCTFTYINDDGVEESEDMVVKIMRHDSADLAKAVMLPKLLYKGPSAEKIIMDAVVEDTKNMGGDNSYQIDIGI